MIYEYLVVNLYDGGGKSRLETFNNTINHNAEWGWRLVCISQDEAYFERPSEKFRKEFIAEITK